MIVFGGVRHRPAGCVDSQWADYRTDTVGEAWNSWSTCTRTCVMPRRHYRMVISGRPGYVDRGTRKRKHHARQRAAGSRRLPGNAEFHQQELLNPR